MHLTSCVDLCRVANLLHCEGVRPQAAGFWGHVVALFGYAALICIYELNLLI